MRTLYATLILAVMFAVPFIYVFYQLGPPAPAGVGRLIGRYMFPFVGAAVIAGIMTIFSKDARSRPGFLLRFNWSALGLWLLTLVAALSRVAQS